MEKIAWTSEQRRIIEASPDKRILVDAAPGTGKTAVACARVAWLIDVTGVAPANIWIISFTRTAVREIRDRIKQYLENEYDASSIKIATLDSHAWAIHSGFDVNAKLIGSYDDNISQVLDQVKKSGDVQDYLGTVEHVLVDEAQDIVGDRANLIVEIFSHLNPDCGVTVLTDDAQSIYGWSVDDESGTGAAKDTLPVLLRNSEEWEFKDVSLETIHRTKVSKLQTIFKEVRKKVISASDDPLSTLAEVKAEVQLLGQGDVPEIKLQKFDGKSTCFVLYRRQADVLLASGFLGEKDHRIRMSGLPICIYPWVGACFGEYTKDRLDIAAFKSLWQHHVNATSMAIVSEDLAWERLVGLAGITRTIVDMKKLRSRLGRCQPPADFCSTDIGSSGPILGTIHSCKGREADVVHLMMPPDDDRDDEDPEEEARVIFVGATRAKSILRTGTGYRTPMMHVKDGVRVYRPMAYTKTPKAMVEFGLKNDITAAGIAGMEYFSAKSVVHENQVRLKSMTGRYFEASAQADRDIGFAYRVYLNDRNGCIAVLSKDVNSDLFSIGDYLRAYLGGNKLRPPDRIEHLRIMGTRTLVLPPESPDLPTLHEPWASSGIMLAPIVLGYMTLFFQWIRNSGRRFY